MLVIGMGNSGGDIAVDVSRVAERVFIQAFLWFGFCTAWSVFYSLTLPPLQVYLSTRSGAWVMGRVGQGGLPGDVVCSSRMQSLIRNLFPNWSTRAVENKLNEAFDHKLYGLKPKHG